MIGSFILLSFNNIFEFCIIFRIIYVDNSADLSAFLCLFIEFTALTLLILLQTSSKLQLFCRTIGCFNDSRAEVLYRVDYLDK